MKLQVLPYVTVEVDDRLRSSVAPCRANGCAINVRAYLLSAADDVDAAGDRCATCATGPSTGSTRWLRRSTTGSATTNPSSRAPAPGRRARSQLRVIQRPRAGAATDEERSRRSPPGPRSSPEWSTPVDLTPPSDTARRSSCEDDLVEYRQVGRVAVVRLLRRRRILSQAVRRSRCCRCRSRHRHGHQQPHHANDQRDRPHQQESTRRKFMCWFLCPTRSGVETMLIPARAGRLVAAYVVLVQCGGPWPERSATLW